MAGEGERREAGDPGADAELLVELADQRFLRRLAGLDLAAGKFPEAGELLAGGALGEQDAAVGVEKRAGGDEQDRPGAFGGLGHVASGPR